MEGLTHVALSEDWIWKEELEEMKAYWPEVDV